MAQGVVGSANALARRAPAGTRQSVRLAGLVEDLRWRVPQGKGPDRRYLMADLSDMSGAYGATCFDAPAQEALEQAKETGSALLLDVELQWREGDEAPRLTVRAATPLAALARNTRAVLTLRLAAGARPALAAELAARLPRGGRSMVRVEVPFAGDGLAPLVLGTDFNLPPGIDQDLADLGFVSSAHVGSLDQPIRLVA
jgi:DNA polymerase-3 subunit alpha